MAQSLSFICSRCLRTSRSPASPLPRRITTLMRARQPSPRSPRHSNHAPPTPKARTQHTTHSRTYSTATHAYTPLTTTSLPSPPPGTSSSSSATSPAPASAHPNPTTVALLNPRTSDDGQPLSISITPRAAHRLGQLMTTDSNPHLALRITVESGGCHGFQYSMSLASDPKAIDGEEDTLFVYSSGGSSSVEAEAASGSSAEEVMQAAQGKAKVVMDLASLELLEGSKVDYVMELIGSQFKIVDNPRATSSCGCGTSFDVKM